MYFFILAINIGIRSSIVTVDAEEHSRAGVLEFNNSGVAVSCGIVVTDFGVAEGDDNLLKMIFMVERLVLSWISLFCCSLSWFVLCIFWCLS